MIFKNFIYILLILSTATGLIAKDDLNFLLKELKNESELSKITKTDSAGLITIFTRKDLEIMQVRTLKDILRSTPLINISRDESGEYGILTPGAGAIATSDIKLYINNHDMTAGYHGGALQIWADVPLDFVDHIEIYRGSSTIEFGNEPGILVIKLYTKSAKREDGGKIRILGDQKGSSDFNAYYAHTTKNDISTFMFAQKGDIVRDKQHYDNRTYDSDTKNSMQYVNVSIGDYTIEAGRYAKTAGAFLISGTDTNIEESSHLYAHITKEFKKKDIKVELSYDTIDFSRNLNTTKIYAGAAGIIDSVDGKSNDTTFMLSVEKRLKFDKHHLLLGTFYKSKKFHTDGLFGSHDTHFNNGLDLYSVYIEDKYSIDKSSMLIASLKDDRYVYNKTIPSSDNFTLKLGYIKNINNSQYKVFLTHTYQALPLFELYDPSQIPFKSDPNLKNPELDILTSSWRYKNKAYTSVVELLYTNIKNAVVFNAPPIGNGSYVNATERTSLQLLTIKQQYDFNSENKITLDVFGGDNTKHYNFSPRYGAIIKLFNRYRKFDIYNQIKLLASYEFANVNVKNSIDYTAGIKYHISRDFSMGLKGENILNRGYQQAYKGKSYTIPVNDQKYWLNLEYLF